MNCVLLGYLSYLRGDYMGKIIMTVEFMSNICARFSNLQSILTYFASSLNHPLRVNVNYSAIFQINKLRLREIK